MAVDETLAELLQQDRISRREFVKFAAVLGISTSAVAGILAETASAAPRAALVGDELTVGVLSPPGALDPQSWNGFTANYAELAMFESLFVLNPTTNHLDPWLASRAAKHESPLIWEYQIRDGVRFHNGDPLTSADVAFTLLRNKQKSWSTYTLTYLKKAEIVDPRTVRVHLTKPDSRFTWQFYNWSPMMILPKNYLTKVGDAGFKTKPVGTGAFRFVSNNPSQIVVEKNPDYWRPSLPKFTKITFEVLEPTTLLAALKSGEVQLSPDVALNQIKVALGLSNLTVESRLGAHIVFTHVNTTKKPFDDVRVRQAMAEALDNTSALAQFPPAFVRPSKGAWIHPDIPGSAYAATNNVYKGDLKKAKQLLSASSVPDGFSAEITVPATRPVELAAALGMQQRLQQIGINLSLKKLTDPDVAAATYTRPRPFDLITYNWALNEPIPIDALAALGSSKAVGSTNFSGYANPQYDSLLDTAITRQPRGSKMRQLPNFSKSPPTTHSNSFTPGTQIRRER